MNKHPDNNLLEAYASGSIDAVSGLVVATHLETCSKMSGVCKPVRSGAGRRSNRKLGDGI